MKQLLIITTLTIGLFFVACQNNTEQPIAPTNTNQSSSSGNPAIDGLTVAINSTPNDPALYFKRAEIFYQSEEYPAAANDLLKALSIDSTNVDYLHLLADAYLDNRDSYKALNTLQKATTMYPKRIPTLLKLCEFQLILKQYPESINTVNEILKIDQLNAEAFFMLGLIFKEQGDLDRAMGSFQTAVENDPDLVDAWINLGQLHAEKESKLAKYFFENAVKVAPNNVDALHAYAEYLHFNDQRAEAIENYRKINSIDPSYEESLFNTGIIYLEMDSLAQAKTHFNMAVEVSPTYIIAYYYRGLVEEKMGDLEAAKKDYQHALNFNPNFERAQEALDRLQ